MPQTLIRPQPPAIPREDGAVLRDEGFVPREAPPVPLGRLHFVDGLRGVAMLMVLFFHCWLHSIGSSVPVSVGRWQIDATLPLRTGYLGVHLFIVLSGLCLTIPLVREGTSVQPLQLTRFFQRRAWRILPPYYVALALFTLLPSVERAVRAGLGYPDPTIPVVTVGQFVSHVFMVHNLSAEWQAGINAAFWSLALETQLYLVFPLLVWGFRRWGANQTLLAVLALTLVYRSWVFFGLDTTQEEVGYIYAYALPGRLFEFVLGMRAAVALAELRQAPLGFSRRRYLMGAMAAGFLGLCVARGWSRFSPITDVLWGVMFYCIVMVAGSHSGTGRRWLTSRPMVALGIISYSVYLIHEPLIIRGYAALHALNLPPMIWLLLFELIAAPLLLAVGWLFFRLVEARFLRAASRPVRGEMYPTIAQEATSST